MNIVINKEIKRENILLKFEYSIIEKETKYDENEINKIINNCFNNKNFVIDDLNTIIIYLRTIFKNFEEKNLKITLDNSNSIIIIIYENTILKKYYKKNKENNCEISYDNVNLNFKSKKIFNNNETKLFVMNEMNNLIKLNNLKELSLPHDAIIINEIYKIFFKQNMDLYDEQLISKVQSIMSILSYHGITLDGDYYFPYNELLNECYSIEIEKLIKKILPLNKIETKYDLELYHKNQIKIIYDTIIQNSNKNELLKTLKEISNIMHTSKYKVRTNDIETLASCLNYNQDIVNRDMILIKKIYNSLGYEY